ncbi:MAG: hypothetical protein R2777_04960 [Chitinophagales bacterium]
MMNMLSVEYSKANVTFDKVAFRFAHQLFEESRIDRSLNKDDRTTNAEKVNAYSVNLDLVKKIKRKTHLILWCRVAIYDKVKSTGEITDINTNETVEDCQGI